MAAMKFGVALPYGSARMVARLAEQAEQAGWDGCFVGDAIWCEDPMIGLAAAAMCTQRIRLGTLVTPVPLRRPWKLASESVALDRLSDGRLILGLGTGAVWMGWQGFPDEVTDVKTRAEMLDETIDILTQLYQRQQADYVGKHYHLKLTALDKQHFPPKPVQQQRIPLWVVGVWPREKSLQRALKCDGIIVEKMNCSGQGEDVTPADIVALKQHVDAQRTLDTPFDIVVSGTTAGLDDAQCRAMLLPWQEAGATWWIEGMWGDTEEAVAARLRIGPPQLV